jgi:hypothetical protein
MAARKPKAQADIEPQSLKFYRDWSLARDDSKSASADLGTIVKEAAAGLDVSKKAFKLASELKRQDPQKAGGFLRDFNRLVREFALDAQIDFVDQLEDQGEDELEPVA